ncbi:unnamed protein product, partial [Heterosigma akashiwo]
SPSVAVLWVAVAIGALVEGHRDVGPYVASALRYMEQNPPDEIGQIRCHLMLAMLYHLQGDDAKEGGYMTLVEGA